MSINLHWGKALALAYAVFAAATMGFVVFALRRPVELVAADYYAQSLRQDDLAAAVRNVGELDGAASIAQTGDRMIAVSVPAAQASSARGAITLYRPSDSTADRIFDLRPGASGRQQLSLDGLAAGAWLVRVRWTAQGRAFYLEQRVFAR